MRIVAIFVTISLLAHGVSTNSNGSSPPLEIRFSFNGPLDGWHCVLVDELTPLGWDDNYVCTNKPLSLIYSSHSDECNRHNSFKCVNLVEPTDRNWFNNRLCLPQDSRVELVWSFCGPVNNMKCVKFDEPWSATIPQFDDNFLCWKEY